MKKNFAKPAAVVMMCAMMGAFGLTGCGGTDAGSTSTSAAAQTEGQAVTEAMTEDTTMFESVTKEDIETTEAVSEDVLGEENDSEDVSSEDVDAAAPGFDLEEDSLLEEPESVG